MLELNQILFGYTRSIKSAIVDIDRFGWLSVGLYVNRLQSPTLQGRSNRPTEALFKLEFDQIGCYYCYLTKQA